MEESIEAKISLKDEMESKIFQIGERIKDFGPEETFIAFEYYPPRSDSGVVALENRMRKMKQLSPLYIDVTWAAGGTSSELTMDLCVKAQEEFGYVANMHLTCTNMPREEVDFALEVSRRRNIRNILALRGDPPVGQVDWKPVDSGFSCALDLVKYIKDFEKREDIMGFFSLSVAAYPEGHPSRFQKLTSIESDDDIVDLSEFDLSEAERERVVKIGNDLFFCSDKDYEEDLQYLKQKVDAGASMIITQMFYDATLFINFRKRCKEYGINVPIIPGIMCVTNYNAFKRMAALCKIRIPYEVKERFELAKGSTEKIKEEGIALAVELSKKCLDDGVLGLHFYTLNLDDVVVSVLQELELFSKEYKDKVTVEQLAG